MRNPGQTGSAATDLEKMLTRHDWFYDYTDDHSVWVRGNRERKDILAALKALPAETALSLWQRYAPKGTDFPFKEAA